MAGSKVNSDEGVRYGGVAHGSASNSPALNADFVSTTPISINSGHHTAQREWRTMEEARNKTAGKRRQLMGWRLRLKEKRQEIRQQRARASDLDVQVMNTIRRSDERGVTLDIHVLAELYMRMQSIRELLGPLEDDYDREEDSYNAAEFEFDEEEEALFCSPEAETTSQDQPEVNRVRSRPTSAHNSLFSPNNPRSSPKRDAFLDELSLRIGDATFIKEKLDNLWAEREMRLEDAKLYPDPSHAEFFANFEEVEAGLRSELASAQANIRALNRKAGVVDAMEHDTPSIYRDWIRERNPVKRWPGFFSQTQSDSVVPHLRNNYSHVRQRINHWIFSNLKYSPLERARHQSILRTELLKDFQDNSLDDETWARNVFAYWRFNETLGSPNECWNEASEAGDVVTPETGLDVVENEEALLLSDGKRNAQEAVLEHDRHFLGKDRVFNFPIASEITQVQCSRYPARVKDEDLSFEVSRSV